jgi:hypothetical protein
MTQLNIPTYEPVTRGAVDAALRSLGIDPERTWSVCIYRQRGSVVVDSIAYDATDAKPIVDSTGGYTIFPTTVPIIEGEARP